MEEDEEIEDTRTLGLSDVLPRKAGVLDPTFSGPRDVERSFTDRGSFVLFFIFIGSVGAIAANAFLFGPGELEKLPRVFANHNLACGTKDFTEDTSVLVWWPREEPSIPSDMGEVLRVCSGFCPQEEDRVCLTQNEVVKETTGTLASPDPECVTEVLVWPTPTIQRFGRCFSDLKSCEEQSRHEREELDRISSMDIAIRALLDMWHCRNMILIVGCGLPILFSYGLVRWLARSRKGENFRIVLPQVTLSLLLSSLPALSLQVLGQKLQGFFDCFYIDKFLMPAVTFIALAILGMALVMAIACVLLRKKLNVCSKLAVQTAKCLKTIKLARNMILFSCMASCFVAVGWFGMGSYVICWTLDLEARDRITPNLRIVILVLFSIGCLWLAAFVGAVSRLTLSGAVSDWFWQHRPKDTKSSVRLSLARTLVKHSGSAAKGSLVLSVLSVWRFFFSFVVLTFVIIVRWIKLFRRIFITIIYNKKVDEVVEIDANSEEVKRKQNKSSTIPVISRLAYNSVALHGRGLIDSGIATKKILKSNYYRVGKCYNLMGEVNVIVTFLILVLCLCLSVIAGSVFQQPNGWGKGSESPLGMILCVTLTSFAAIQGAFAPFNQANTALIQCFCEDLDRNDGSPVSPYRAYKGLRELVANEHQDVFNTNKKQTGDIVLLKVETNAEKEEEESKLKKARTFLLQKISKLPKATVNTFRKATGNKVATNDATV